jgi:hypothetical protein
MQKYVEEKKKIANIPLKGFYFSLSQGLSSLSGGDCAPHSGII